MLIIFVIIVIVKVEKVETAVEAVGKMENDLHHWEKESDDFQERVEGADEAEDDLMEKDFEEWEKEEDEPEIMI